ncbi:hypothetical protein H2204_012295 [Knufia peltigerae]|uniref:Xaa-Pro dipeptidyl-peptidase C-terminal domain-containing protein n=1 Tax=Knufia peltigerae TaxID=1002370 RepID=A0AA38XSK8_9EURO|nr:hypothetical protein H2204_012295 [Knufia peltigerae]
MPLELKNLHVIDDQSFDYVFERDVDIPLKTTKPAFEGDPLIVRANVYRPKKPGRRFPVLVTYGPYGKDIPYSQFHAASFAEVNPKHKSTHSAWEVPDPLFWTSNDYVVVRADERGTGNSPGFLDSMSSGTCDGFADVIEWCADQPWSSGRVGLLGISYYAGSQWRAAARNPKGLACIIPWEEWWYDRQVGSNQYGLGGRTERNWGTDSLEGVLSAEELSRYRAEQPVDCANNRYRDDVYFASRDFKLSDVKVPVLSVANWGGIHLHLRGNVLGYLGVGSEFKYLRFITGRHDLPFFYDEEVKVQKSFLDACLKGDDPGGWLSTTPGSPPPVSLCVRQGNPGFNDAEAERLAFPRRAEWEWPIARTVYTNYHLRAAGEMSTTPPPTTVTTASGKGTVSYEAPKGRKIFKTPPFTERCEITGHPTARLSVSLSPSSREEEGPSTTPTDMDIFLTLRHYDRRGTEIFYTGAVGDPVPVVRGWLRLSLRSLTSQPTFLSDVVPERDYLSTDLQPVEIGKVYTVDVEIWPTCVVVEAGEALALEVSSCDSPEGVSLFGHNHPDDRAESVFKGYNHLHVGGSEYESYLRLPIVPPRVG